MKADELSPEKTAQDMNLPLSQVKEALAYYETHQDLIESETVEFEFGLQQTNIATFPSKYKEEQQTLSDILGFDPDDEEAMRQIAEKQHQALLAFAGSITTDEPDDASVRHDEYLYGSY